MLSKVKRKKGQSTIEFAFVLFAFISFLSLSYNAVVAFSVYQYFSYANFMAARAMQVGRGSIAAQEQAAYKVMQVYVPGIQVNDPDSGSASQEVTFGFNRNRILAKVQTWLVPRARSADADHPFILIFKVPLITIPMGEDLKQSFGWITLKTSVALGREPTSDECHLFFGNFFVDMGGKAPHSPDGMEDNGC